MRVPSDNIPPVPFFLLLSSILVTNKHFDRSVINQIQNVNT